MIKGLLRFLLLDFFFLFLWRRQQILNYLLLTGLSHVSLKVLLSRRVLKYLLGLRLTWSRLELVRV